MNYWLIVLAFIVAVADWYAVYRGKRVLGYITKPGVMLVLLLWLVFSLNVFAYNGDAAGLKYFFWGLAFSMAGDIFLMFPKEQFIAGLVAFLIGHLMYVGGFWLGPWADYMVKPGVVLALVMVPILLLVFWRLLRAVAAKKKALVVPVAIYAATISVMVYLAIFSAFIYRNWAPLPGYLVAAGALLFMLSDMILSWNKFVVPIEHGRLKTRIAYHTGQILLTVGAAIYFTAFV